LANKRTNKRQIKNAIFLAFSMMTIPFINASEYETDTVLFSHKQAREFITNDINEMMNRQDIIDKSIDFLYTLIPFTLYFIEQNISKTKNLDWTHSKNIYGLRIDWQSLPPNKRVSEWEKTKLTSINTTTFVYGRENLSVTIRFLNWLQEP